MNLTVIIIVIFFTTGTVNAQSNNVDIKQLLDSTFHYTQATSVYTDKVNWDTLKDSVYKRAANATTVAGLKPALTYLLNNIDDYHGRYFDAATFAPIAWFTDWDRINAGASDKRERNPAVFRMINDTSMKFSYRLLKNNIGYLRITGIAVTADMQKEAQKIRNAVIQLANKNVTKWIIDLRYNGGGNMNPMMAGLAPLIGNGFVGYLSNLKKDTLNRWTIAGNSFYWDDYKAVDLLNKPIFKKLPKLAVLTSRYTTSSGEFVATALKGRPGTRFFGEATGSFTTGTNWITVGGKIIISISEGFYCDRNGNMYTLNLPVDEEADFDPLHKTLKDDGIEKAIIWLNKK